jgi:hypothetical protein
MPVFVLRASASTCSSGGIRDGSYFDPFHFSLSAAFSLRTCS